MIRVYVTKDKDAQSVMIVGHGRADVCAAVTATLNGLQAGLAFIAREYPRECKVSVLDRTGK